MKNIWLLLLIGTSAFADDCAETTNAAMIELLMLDPIADSNEMFCTGKPTLKRFVGYETLLSGVPADYDSKNVSIEDIGYSDGMLCEEEFTLMNTEDDYVKSFNENMVLCLEGGKQCCSDVNKQ
jgi:hypothetical protein